MNDSRPRCLRSRMISFASGTSNFLDITNLTAATQTAGADSQFTVNGGPVQTQNTNDVAENLDRSYEYFHHLLVTANIIKVAEPIDEWVQLRTSIHDTWQELFAEVEREETLGTPPAINKHGASVMNLEG